MKSSQQYQALGILENAVGAPAKTRSSRLRIVRLGNLRPVPPTDAVNETAEFVIQNFSIVEGRPVYLHGTPIPQDCILIGG